MSIIYLRITYFTYAISKWRTIFKYYFFLLPGAAAVPMFRIAIAPLTCMYVCMYVSL